MVTARRRDVELINKKKEHLLNFAVPMDYIVKMKESQNINKYLDLARGLKNKNC